MRIFPPHPELSPYIDCVWLQTPSGREPAKEAELALPTGTVELVIEVDGNPVAVRPAADLKQTRVYESPLLCGVHSLPFALPEDKSTVLGVHFRPAGAFALLPLPLDTLKDIHVSLFDVEADFAGQLQERVMAAKSALALNQTVQTLLLERLSREVHPLARDLSFLNTLPDVQTLVDRSGYSHRRFNQIFREAVGLTPKRFIRVTRFQRTLQEINTQGEADWQDIVASCGYYDQAHLIHEFQTHALMTPGAYLASRGPRINHPSMID